jgi:hypothetical protein
VSAPSELAWVAFRSSEPGYVAIANEADMLDDFRNLGYSIVPVSRAEAVRGWNQHYEARRLAQPREQTP